MGDAAGAGATCHPVVRLSGSGDRFRHHRPRSDDPLEAPLAAGIDEARRRSRSVIEGLLPGRDLDAVVRPSDPTAVVQASPGVEVLTRVVGGDVVDATLGHHEMPPTRLRVLSNAQSQPFEEYAGPLGTWPGAQMRGKGGHLAAAIASGATVSVDGLDELLPSVERLAEHVERVFECTSLINLYVSAGATSGTAWHWDDHDVLVLQLEGDKHWEVHAPTEPAPLRGYVDDRDPGGVVTFEGRLAPGDVLYVPRGSPHLVSPQGGRSVHVTIGLTRRRAQDVINWLGNVLGHDGRFRADVPLDDDGFDRWFASALAAEAETAVRRYRGMAPALYRSRATTSVDALSSVLLDGDWTGVTARLALPGGVVVEEGSEEGVVLAGGRERWRVEAHAVPNIGRLLAAEPVLVDELESTCDAGWGCPRTLVAQLAVDGVLVIARPEPVERAWRGPDHTRP